MKKLVPQGESKLVNGLWYNQGEEYEDGLPESKPSQTEESKSKKQSEKKDEVFASFKKNKKAEAKDIPAATQIFTPNWIVKYMVENTAGKIWLDKHPNSSLKSQMKYLVENDTQVEVLRQTH